MRFLTCALAVEKWQALNTILEAFGNSSTSLNANATRFSQIISLDFDQAGQVASASVQVREDRYFCLLGRMTSLATPEGIVWLGEDWAEPARVWE